MSEHPILERFKKAKQRKDFYRSLYEDCYRYAIPHRETFTEDEGSGRTKIIFDSTAPDSTVRFANRAQMTMVPPEQVWMKYAAGDEIPKGQQAQAGAMLDAVTERFFQLLRRTNFDTEINEVFIDLAVGTGSFLIEAPENGTPATFTAVPASQVILSEGPTGSISDGAVFREHKLEANKIKLRWPTADLPSDFIARYGAKAEEKIDIVEATWWDPKKKLYVHEVFISKDQKKIFGFEDVSSPWVIVRLNKTPGEIYGRGPLVNALPDIKTLNKTVEMVLQNAALAVSGVYTAADDGVLNPDTVEIAPGVVIPVGFNGGVNGRSLDVLPRSGDFSVAELVLNDLRASVRRKLFDDQFDGLSTTKSQFEAQERLSSFAESVGPAFSRIQVELMWGVVKRCTHLWVKSGELPEFKIDGKLVTLQQQSPLSQVQANEDLSNLDRTVARMNGIQPGLATIALNIEEVAPYIAKKHGIPQVLTRTTEEIKQSMEQLGQAVSQNPDMAKMIPQQ